MSRLRKINELNESPDRPPRSRQWNGSSLLKPKTVVWHLIFGLGSVIKHRKERHEVEIDFRSCGRKVLIPVFARSRLRVVCTPAQPEARQ